MNFIQQQKLACELIKNDLLNHKLISGLALLEIDASSYYLSIFLLMGLESSDLLSDRYYGLLNQALNINLSYEKELHKLAKEVYEALLKPL